MKHASVSKYNFSRFAPRLLAGLIVTSVMLASPAFALEETSQPAVGLVSLVLGKAYIEKPDGTRERVTVGTAINVKDLIETGSNGHVHIRFVDQELVSVRPSSRFEILRYDYNAASPQDSYVKLNLIEGVTRAISGKAAEAARENFRLDTPIAAIGVRGTDFVVRSDEDGVLAQVNEGAIIVAPYSAECSAAAFGPCSLNALELAGGADQIVQVNSNTNQALLLSLSPPPVTDVPVVPAQTAAVVATTEAKTKDEGLYTDSATSKTATHLFAVARNVSNGNGNGTIPPTSIDPPITPPPVIEDIPEFTPDLPVAVASLASNQLVWGRYYDTNDDFERITAFVDTFKDSTRGNTVGNNAYGLFRTQDGSKDVQRGLGSLGFNLTQAQALYRVNGQSQSELMNVTGGVLNIDFENSRFATNLQMNHAATGNVEFSESGRIFSTGIFHGTETNGVRPLMTGAVSLDGQEAGYFFEKTLESGVIEGLTLWGVKP